MNLEDLPLFTRPPTVGILPTETRQIQTVTELTQRIRATLEPSFSQVWVQGEISNYRPAASGHLYFSIKDSGSSISAALFGANARKLKFDVRDGLEVVCRGKISVYSPRGTYQLVVDQIEPLGAGALQLAFEQLKEKLLKEGLFETSRKRTLPPYPQRIAVITSPSGAAIQDMLKILSRRAPHMRVTVIPALVQGAEAASQILRGIEIANRHSLGDIIVLARGGGSIEDLWCFNDEALARGIATSRLPVISAVGHEIDFTIADFVADLRAPTPSAAVEIVSGSWVDSAVRVREAGSRILVAARRDLANRKVLLSHVSARLVSPGDRVRERMQACDEIYQRIERALINQIRGNRSRMENAVAKLEALSPLRVLERGYSIVRAEGGGVLRSALAVQPGQKLEIKFHDGDVPVQAL